MRLLSHLLAFIALLVNIAEADVEFTSPAAGDHVAAGTINVQWKESGVAPLIKDLGSYTLLLMVGGNDESGMLPIATFMSAGVFSGGNNVSGTIPSGIAGPVPNGFFFQISSSSSNGSLINYSKRFTITGLTGTILSKYRDAAEALNGSTDGPNNIGESSSSITTSPTTSAALKGASPTLTNTVTITSNPTATVTSTPSSSSSLKLHAGKLSTIALVGIAIAGAVVGLIGIALAMWAFFRRKRRRDHGIVRLDDNVGSSEDVARKEMTVVEPVELDPYARIVEADNGARRPEMDSLNIRAELEGDFIHTGILDTLGRSLTPPPETPIENLTLRSTDFYNLSTDTLASPVTPRDNV